LKKNDEIENLDSEVARTYEDNFTKWMPLCAVLLFTAMMSYVAFDSFVLEWIK